VSASCCGPSPDHALNARQTWVLKVVLAINAVMFVGEFAAGWIANSTALMGDSLDMLSDALVYGFSLWAVGRGDIWRNRAALTKGWFMVACGFIVLAEAAYKFTRPVVPEPGMMYVVGTLALLANLSCLYLLYRHRGDDLNMKSTWICSRNDIFANSAVLGAAWLVSRTGLQWPDLVVGLCIAFLFLSSAVGIIRESRAAIAGGRAVDEHAGHNH
jgi:cation diffusion facilitator family transporter